MSSATAKLYYTPTSCGAASFIAAFTANVNIDTEQVNVYIKKTASGADFYSINPKGNVPCLVVGDVVINEGAAVLQWIADQAPSSGLAPAAGTIERYQLQTYLNYIASEIQPMYALIFREPDVREIAIKKLYTKFDYLNKHVVNGKSFLLGNKFTVADSYLYITLTWQERAQVSLDEYPHLKAYYEGIKALPNVIAAHKKMAELPAAPTQ